MPTYDYECNDCGHTFEYFQYYSEEPLSKCPHCKTGSVKRLISGGAGIIFKGSGFYTTDYNNNAKREEQKKSTSISEPNNSSETKKFEDTA